MPALFTPTGIPQVAETCGLVIGTTVQGSGMLRLHLELTTDNQFSPGVLFLGRSGVE